VARVVGPDAVSISLLATGFRDLALAADEQARAAAVKGKPGEPSTSPAAAPSTEPAAEPAAAPAGTQPASTSAAGQPPAEGATASANETAPTATPLTAIVPPVAIAQNIPRPNEVSVPLGGPQTILLDIVIDETGRVERAEVRKSVDRLYETQLVAATRGWRYTPATQGGRPVKYLRTLEVTLNPH
jgi:TonB family protein